MNVSDFNETIKALTTGTKPKDRRDLVIEIGDETAAYLRVIGIQWDLVVPVGCCQVYAGCGRRIEVRPSWRSEGMSALCIGDNSGSDFRIRGCIEFPTDADIKVTEAVQ